MPNRTVFFISDGTGITAETFGNAILAQFEMKTRHIRLPFLDTVDKAHQAVRQINHTAEVEGTKPIVFTTLVNMEVLKVIQEGCKGMLLDMFGTFVQPLEKELGINPTIASLSFGEERFFHLQHNTDKNLKLKILLEHGSLLIMKGTTQHYWKHHIPKTSKPIGNRINLTFRKIV